MGHIGRLLPNISEQRRRLLFRTITQRQHSLSQCDSGASLIEFPGKTLPAFKKINQFHVCVSFRDSKTVRLGLLVEATADEAWRIGVYRGELMPDSDLPIVERYRGT